MTPGVDSRPPSKAYENHPQVTISIINSAHSSQTELPKTLGTKQPEDDEHIPPFSASFTDKNLAKARSTYLQILIGGAFGITVAMFAVFSIYWGALWKTPAHSLNGWVVDFDGSTVGNAVSEAVLASSSSSEIQWTSIPTSMFPGGVKDVMHMVLEEKAWVAVVINSEVTSALNSAVESADPRYDSSSAVSVYAQEARNENAFRAIIRPTVQEVLEATSEQFALQSARQITSSSAIDVQSLLSNAPQVITRPVGYTVINMRPFDIPVATAITFVGLIYLLILSFFFVMIAMSARDASGLERHLSTGSIIRLRLVSTFIAHFFISLFYSLLSKGFQVDFSRTFGKGGFVIFWMLNYFGMLALGLALEANITVLTIKGIPIFMILWIITNVSVALLPIEILPKIYRYGYASPFYNVSQAVRTILFDTRNTLGLNFGVLIAWVATSCITLTIFQWVIRRIQTRELRRERNRELAEKRNRVSDEPPRLSLEY
ncbi:hypothetical protein L218DRAFT_1016242 [Marasmius fiardii PR-910]|nr:hypothetical protein L218DRAFT_1016242 [Marasmius fiardii PR-910]